MERSLRILLSLLLLIAGYNSGNAIDYKLPHDPFTLEALISAHKEMKKAEDLAVLQIEANHEQQSFITKTTSAINKVQTTLNKRMSDVNSYILLASSIVTTSTKLKNLTQEYYDFSKKSFKSVGDNALLGAFFIDANARIAKEVKYLTKLIASYTASGMNILKATNDEKIKLIFLIQSSISQIRNTIYSAEIMMKTMQRYGYDVYYITDILTDDFRETLSGKLINEWNRQ